MTCSPCSYVSVSVSMSLSLDGSDLPAMAATGDSLGPHGVPRQQGRCRRPQPSVPISSDPKATTPICLVFYNPPLHLLLAGSPPSLSQPHLALLIFHLSGFPIPDSTLASLCSTPIKHTQHRWNKVPAPA